MSTVTLSSRPVPAFLPPFRALASAGFMANAPLLALAFLLGRTWLGLSLIGGYALGMLIYGFLYGIIGRGLSAAVRPGEKRLPANFGLLMAGKLVVFGGATALLLCVLHVAALPMLAGLLLTQIGVTASVMRFLKNNKVTD